MGCNSGSLPITTREREVLLGLALRKTNEQISDELGISVATVRVHMACILLKLSRGDQSGTTTPAPWCTDWAERSPKSSRSQGSSGESPGP